MRWTYHRSNEILLWRFQSAPECLRLLSESGGDEDWLALVPRGVVAPLNWDDYDTPGLGITEVHPFEGGQTVYIWSHA